MFFLLGNCYNTVIAQQGWTIDLLKKEEKTRPAKFGSRQLGSERMAAKKFTKPRQFIQNNFTHFNYYFNANNKLNLVIEKASAQQKDDFNRLISFYPYTLANTRTQKTDLDSVILKATAGILLHDLRNDWIDNMYLLIGKSYYLKNELDSALATF
ncbi:MAG: hypothetical protein HY305_05935, partial [Sphingobacteriales bacterium]|nr:hypothetical protein [Sphingobacteriales bacterium]